jgi:uncharacterized protein (TIGR02452 family)
MNYSKKDRIMIQRKTIEYVDKNKAKFKSTIIKYQNNLPTLPNNKPTFNTKITVCSTDTLETVINLIYTGLCNVSFLVFANATNPGGRYQEGTPAQEESICRRTNLVSCFGKMSYPIPEFGCFYINNLAIIRDTENNNYTMYDKPINTSCVVQAAYHAPPTDTNDKLCSGYREKTKLKIQQILNAFLVNENYNIVLGAFGCGAFGNPVNDIANIFKEILDSDEYKNRFQSVTFAVLKEAGGNNYKTFVRVFNNE